MPVPLRPTLIVALRERTPKMGRGNEHISEAFMAGTSITSQS
jgi:hypothetical protein